MSEIKQQYYEIYIGGKKLDEEYLSLISEITLEDNASGADLLTIEITDPDFKFIEDNFFIEDTPVTFKGGWMGEDFITFEGFISIIDVDFPSTGSPTLTLHCIDNSHIMNRKAKKRTWSNTTRSEVARAIFVEHGFIPVIDDISKVEESISQNNQTDIAFLVDLAKDCDEEYICYVEGNHGYFVKRKILDTPQDILEYRTGNGRLLSFRPRINKESKQEEIDKSTINAETGEVVRDIATNDTPRELQGEAIQSKEGRRYIGNSKWIKVSTE